MTPTLSGRWQTRFFLTVVVGLPVALFFVIVFRSNVPLLVLGMAFVSGLIWDVFYNRFQEYFWDHDWPPILQVAASVYEGCFIAVLIFLIGLLDSPPSGAMFVLNYSTVWLATFIASHSLLRIIFPHWRFRGGRWF